MNELAELEAIRRLKARYFRCLDTQDWAGWRDCFTEDLEARFDGAPGPGGPSPLIVTGADALVTMISGNLAGAVTVHHGHMPEITLTAPDAAIGRWAMVDRLRTPGAPAMNGYGHYLEEYRKPDSEWRIARLHVTRLRVDHSE